MNANSVSSKYGSENNETNTVQFEKLGPEIPQLHDTKCIAHGKNWNAKHKITLKPRQQAVNESIRSMLFVPSFAIADEGLPLLESQLSHAKLLDNSQFSFYTPKPSASCLTDRNHSKHMVHFPAHLPILPHLKKHKKFVLLPRPVSNKPLEILEVNLG